MTAVLLTLRRRDDPEPPDWRDAALCAQRDPDLWFPPEHSRAARAKAVCRACPARPSCLLYAFEHPSENGVWGGFSERARLHAGRKWRAGVSVEAIIAADNARFRARTERDRVKSRERKARAKKARARSAARAALADEEEVAS